MITKHQRDLLHFLYLKQHATTIDELASHFKRSQRSIRYDLDALDAFAATYKYRIDRIPSLGIRFIPLMECFIDQLLEQTNPSTAEYRRDWMLYHLIRRKGISISEGADALQVSRSTITRDVDECEKILLAHGCTLTRNRSGIHMVGHEMNVSQLILSLVSSSHKVGQYRQLAQNQHRKLAMDVIQWMDALQSEHQFILESNSYELVSTFVLLNAIRHQESDVLACDEDMGVPYVSGWKISAHAKRLCLRILPGLRVISGNLPVLALEDSLALELFDQLNQALNHRFFEDKVASQTLLLHLRATLHRIRHQQFVENPLKEDVFVSYALLSEVIKEEVRVFESRYQLQFNDDEIAFITMHIQAMIQRKTSSLDVIKVAVVCHHGLATSQLLISRLQSLFPSIPFLGPYSQSEYQSMKDEMAFDYIVTTLDLQQENQLLVLPILSGQDIEMIERKISNHVYVKQCEELIKGYKQRDDRGLSMQSLIKKEHIKMAQRVSDYKEAVTLAAIPLVKDQVIEYRYIQKMIWAISNLGPYMVILPQVAFVHAGTEDGVIKNGISCLHLETSVLFGEKKVSEVKVIFVIASTSKEDAGLLKLVSLLEDTDNLKRLLQSKTIEDIWSLSKEG